MNTKRIFNSSKFFQPSAGEPIRSVITESPDAVIVAWYIQTGQEIAAHIHPQGQDTWTILSGRGDYYLDQAGNKQSIKNRQESVQFILERIYFRKHSVDYRQQHKCEFLYLKII